MQGYAALWLPGTDHASIATEVKVVEAMAKEGLTKADLGREGFWSVPGIGRMSIVKGLADNLGSWVHPVTGPGNDLPWMRDAVER